jgi:hypothetical protein
MGFTGLALSAMLFRDGASARRIRGRPKHARPDGRHFGRRRNRSSGSSSAGSQPRQLRPEAGAESVRGKSIDDTPFKDLLDPKRVFANLVDINPAHGNRKVLLPLQTGYKRYGQCGLEVGDWFRHIGECADDLAVVRSLWTLHNDHGTQLTWHTGRHPREGAYPTIGSWVSCGLGSMNESLPEYVVLGEPTGDCCGGAWTHGAAPGWNAGVRLRNPKDPLPFISPAGGGVLPEEQAAEFSPARRLALAGIGYGRQGAARAHQV